MKIKISIRISKKTRKHPFLLGFIRKTEHGQKLNIFKFHQCFLMVDFVQKAMVFDVFSYFIIFALSRSRPVFDFQGKCHFALVFEGNIDVEILSKCNVENGIFQKMSF